MTGLRVALAAIGIIIFAILIIAGFLEAGSRTAVRSYMGAVPSLFPSLSLIEVSP